MFSMPKLGTKSSATHCTAPTGKNGRHCGRRIGYSRMSNGVTCLRQECQLWLMCK